MSTATAMSPGSTHGSVQGCGLDCPQPEVKRQRADRQPHQAPGGGASLDHHRTRHVAERGELAEALALAKRLLGQHPGLAEYREVRELSRRLGIWQESRSELLAQWATARQYDLLTDVYLEEGEIDQALKLVKQYGRIYAFAAGQLIRVAQAASETHPRPPLKSTGNKRRS